MINWLRLFAVVNKEFIHIRRDKLTLGIILGIPIIQLTLFGYAVNTNVDHIPTIVCDLSNSREARLFVDRLVNTSYFDLVGHVGSFEEARAAIDQERAKVAVLFKSDYSRSVKRGSAEIGVLVDASDPLLASSALSASAQVGLDMNIEVIGEQLTATGGVTAPYDVRVRALYNPDLRSANYIVPGLIGVILTMTMVLVTAVAIVRERESGALEALITTPVSKAELMIGKIIPYVVVGFVQMSLVLLIAIEVFDIQLRGSFVELYAIGFVFIVASLGVGMVISTIAKTQIQAMQMAFFFFLPNILLSGFMFPVSSMPWIIQKLSHVLPLTYFLITLRGILLKGSALANLWEFVWPLALFAPVIVIIGILRFSKKLS
jgi:drug efflux transport system permease protein